MAALKPGDKAPAFALKDQRGRTVKLSDFEGRKVLVFFYPKADTPACTRQARSFPFPTTTRSRTSAST